MALRSRPRSSLVALALLALLAGYVLAGVGPSSSSSAPSPSKGLVALRGQCEALSFATNINLFCVRAGAGGLSTACCRFVVGAVARGGLICLCRIAVTPTMATSGYGAGDLLSWYEQCGGKEPVDAYLLSKCGIGTSAEKELPAQPLPRLHSSGIREPEGSSSLPKKAYEGHTSSNENEDRTSQENGVSSKMSPKAWTSNEKSKDDGALPNGSKRIVIILEVKTWHVILGVLLSLLVILLVGLAVYVKRAAPGPRRDMAEVLLRTILPFLPALLQEAVRQAQDQATEEETADG